MLANSGSYDRKQRISFLFTGDPRWRARAAALRSAGLNWSVLTTAPDLGGGRKRALDLNTAGEPQNLGDASSFCCLKSGAVAGVLEVTVATVSDPQLPGGREAADGDAPRAQAASVSTRARQRVTSHDLHPGHTLSRSSRGKPKPISGCGEESRRAADLEGGVLPVLPGPPRRRSLKPLPRCTFCPEADKSRQIRRGSLLPPTGPRRKFPEARCDPIGSNHRWKR